MKNPPPMPNKQDPDPPPHRKTCVVSVSLSYAETVRAPIRSRGIASCLLNVPFLILDIIDLGFLFRDHSLILTYRHLINLWAGLLRQSQKNSALN